MQLVRVQHPAEFRFSAVVQATGEPTPSDKALSDLGNALDLVWHEMPYVVQDFLLRTARMVGWPIDYPGFPFWMERVARHVIFIMYPSLRKTNFSKPTTEDFGKVTGHMLAFIIHAKEGTAIFARLPRESSVALKNFFTRVETPVRVLMNEGLSRTPEESAAFLKGLNAAFSRTFDAVGMPIGWNTNSPVLLGIALMWRAIVAKSPTLPEVHKELVKMLGDVRKPGKGEAVVGSEDRVKKICQRVGLRFSGNRAVDSAGTAVILAVPPETKAISDK